MAHYCLQVSHITFPKRFITDTLRESGLELDDKVVKTRGGKKSKPSQKGVFIWFYNYAHYNVARGGMRELGEMGEHSRLAVERHKAEAPTGLWQHQPQWKNPRAKNLAGILRRMIEKHDQSKATELEASEEFFDAPETQAYAPETQSQATLFLMQEGGPAVQ